MPPRYKDHFDVGGRRVGYSLYRRDKVIGVLFQHPTEPGGRLRRSTGCTTYAEAITAAAKVILAAYKPHLDPDPVSATWADVFEAVEQSHVRPKTQEGYVDAVKRLTELLPACRGPGDVTEVRAREFARLFRRGRRPQTVLTNVANLHSVWKILADRGLAGSSPWPAVRARLEKPDKPEPRVPTDAEVRGLVEFFARRFARRPAMVLFLRVKLTTGRRLFDLCQLRSDQLKGDVLTIHASQDKTRKQLSFPLPADLAADLHRLKGADLLFGSIADTPTRILNAMQHGWRKYRDRGGKVRSHDLRRFTLTTVAVAVGVDRAAEVLGVHPAVVRKHYLDSARLADRDAVLRQMAGALDVASHQATQQATPSAEPAKTPKKTR